MRPTLGNRFGPLPTIRRALRTPILGCIIVFTIGAGHPAVAQEETETSPIVQTVTVTASVAPSCAFWLDRTWMSIGAYEGDGLLAENAVNFRCSVLPSNLNDSADNFAPVCFDAGAHFVPQADPNDRLSPRSMLVDDGSAGNPDHRLDYVILNRAQSNLIPNPTGSLGTGLSYQVCRDANPGGNHHPGILLGWNINPESATNQSNTTYSLPIFFYVLAQSDQRGAPVPGNYADTVTVYFVFKDP